MNPMFDIGPTTPEEVEEREGEAKRLGGLYSNLLA
jgi:hypothetical protein